MQALRSLLPFRMKELQWLCLREDDFLKSEEETNMEFF